jgi:hypothetical protein
MSENFVIERMQLLKSRQSLTVSISLSQQLQVHGKSKFWPKFFIQPPETQKTLIVCLFVCYYASRRDAMYLRIILAQFYKFQ